MIGSIGPFIVGQEDIESYIQRLDSFIKLNKIADTDKSSALFSIMGPKAFGLLKDLVSPADITALSYSEISLALINHFKPQRNIIFERFKFHSKVQDSDESLTDFVAGLKSLASTCEFGQYLDEALRDRFVVGINDSYIQQQLLAVSNLSCVKAVEIANSCSSAKKESNSITTAKQEKNFNSHKIQSRPSSGMSYNAQKIQSRSPSSNFSGRPNSKNRNVQSNSYSCYSCGGNHMRKECKYRDATCHTCNRKGHLSKVCKSSSVPNTSSYTDTGTSTLPQQYRHPSSKANSGTSYSSEYDYIFHCEEVPVQPYKQTL